MNIQQLYIDYGIPTASDSDKHYRSGWVNVACPFCSGSTRHHLGYNINGDYFYCWRCGKHPLLKTLMTLLKMDYHEVKKLIYQYKGKVKSQTPKINIRKKAFRTPSNLKDISVLPLHRKYLRKRGFDPLLLENEYNIKGIGPVGGIDKIDLSFRIFIPVFYNGRMVSWQTRDITGNSALKYLSCSLDRELVPHKEILYKCPDVGEIVLVEGVFDVWKIDMAGYHGTCCFGIEYKVQQLKLLMNYDKIIIFFDSEKQAQAQAGIIKSRLEFMGKEVVNVVPPDGEDPGSLTVKQIKELLG